MAKKRKKKIKKTKPRKKTKAKAVKNKVVKNKAVKVETLEQPSKITDIKDTEQQIKLLIEKGKKIIISFNQKSCEQNYRQHKQSKRVHIDRKHEMFNVVPFPPDI